MTTNESKIENTKKPKNQGPIRWNAIVIFTVLILLFGLYFKLFFDSHMKSFMEWAGYKALGTEVNINKLETSFASGQIAITQIQITSAEKPDFNSIELGSIRFGFSWDALLRLKFVVDEMAVESVQFMSKRAYPGKVAPPDLPTPDKSSLVSQLQDQALNKVESKNKNNILGDFTAFLKTGDYKQQLNSIESQLESKKLAEELEKKWKSKQVDWDLRVKNLPKEKDFAEFKKQFESIKSKDFKSPQELNESIKKFNELKQQAEDKVKIVNDFKTDLKADLKAIETDYKTLDDTIKSDISSIKDRLKIPKINAAAIAKSMFMDYLTPYISKLDKAKNLAEKYLPPKYSKMVTENLSADKLLNKKTSEAKDEETSDDIQPHARDEGVSYEFPVTTGYPLFWIKKISISSKSNSQADYGDIEGLITHVVSNQRQINKPTELNINGDFKSKNITGIKVYGLFDNLKPEPVVNFNFAVKNYPLQNLDLINSPDGKISLPSTALAVDLKTATDGFKTYTVALNNNFYNAQFVAEAKDKNVNELVKGVFSQINEFDLTAKAEGELSRLDFDVQSSLGEKLEKAFSATIQQKIDEINNEIKAKIDKEISQYKSQFEKQIQQFTKGYSADAQGAESQLNNQKAAVDNKVDLAKKDLENKAKDKVKDEGKKVLDGLKKKFKF